MPNSVSQNIRGVDHAGQGDEPADPVVTRCPQHAHRAAHAVSRVNHPAVAGRLHRIDHRAEVADLLADGAIAEIALRVAIPGKGKAQRGKAGRRESIGQSLGPGAVEIARHPVADQDDAGGVGGVAVEAIVEYFAGGVGDGGIHGISEIGWDGSR
jgi:hypothetical protein